MSSKNPFELRAQVLHLAKQYMDQQYQMNIKFAQDMFEQGQKTIEDVHNAYQMYSMEELMEKAKEMYTFVSDRKS